MQHADGKRMVCWTRNWITQVGYFMEYDAVAMACHFERIENVIAVFSVDAPLLCDSRGRKVTR